MVLNQEERFQILNIISFIAVIIVNALANLLPFNGYQTGEISRMYPNLFTPAPITFSIWSLIYFTLALFVIYQAQGLISSQEAPTKLLKKVGYLFFLSSAANIGWLFAWHYLKIKLSFLIMLLLLVSLLVIYHSRLNIGMNLERRKEKVFVQLPFSLYTAWITVATFANLTVLIVDLNLYGKFIPAQLWTIALILITVFLTVYFYRRDIYYNLVISWALLGIIIKRVFIAEELVSGVVLAAGLGILIIGGSLISIKEAGS